MKPRAEQPDKSRGGCGALLVVVFLVVLPVLYVASLGPAAWLVVNGYLDDAKVTFAYSPLKLAYDHNQFVRAVLERYIEWWTE